MGLVVTGSDISATQNTLGYNGSILLGQGANETLAGGAGDDSLIGGGQQTITATYDATAGKLNTLLLSAGVTESNIVLGQAYDNNFGGNRALKLNIADSNSNQIERLVA
jgi:hypothetical protein